MSNDDSTTPNGPRDDSETGLGRLGQDPDETIGSTPPAGDPTSVFDAPPTGESAPGGPGSVDATQVMPSNPTLPSQPPVFSEPAVPRSPEDATTVPLTTRPPRQRQSGLLAGVLIGLLLIGAGLAFFILTGGDDDEGVVDDVEAAPIALVVTRIDANGAPLGTTLAAEVASPDGEPFTWTSPADVAAGEPGRIETDSSGRAEFGWLPTGEDPGAFESTVVLREFVGGLPDGGGFVESVEGQCLLTRDGEQGDLAIDTSLVADTENDSTTQAGEYTFPNATFRSGDRVECTLSDVGPGTPPPTTVPPESTTIPETTVPVTTTTTPEVPPPTEAPTTTAAPTTTTTTTTTTSTTTTTTVPEPALPTLGDALRAEPDLSRALALLESSGLLADLESETSPFTLFVPDNTAIEELEASADPPDLDDPAVVEALLLTHLQLGAQVDDPATVRQIVVENGGPQPVDAATDPITIGGVPLLRTVGAVDGGVVHVLAGVLTPQ